MNYLSEKWINLLTNDSCRCYHKSRQKIVPKYEAGTKVPSQKECIKKECKKNVLYGLKLDKKVARGNSRQ